MFRDVWQDEYDDGTMPIKPYYYVWDEENQTTVKKNSPLPMEDGKHYKVFFHCKSRNGEAGRTVVYEFIQKANKRKEIGYCHVKDENKL